MKTLLTPSQFDKLPDREKWDMSKTMKNVMWTCGSCHCDQGLKPERTFEQLVCSECDSELTHRTGGGQSDPFHYSFYYTKIDTKLLLELAKVRNYTLDIFGCDNIFTRGIDSTFRHCCKYPDKMEICKSAINGMLAVYNITLEKGFLDELHQYVFKSYEANDINIYIDWLKEITDLSIAAEIKIIVETKNNMREALKLLNLTN